MDGADLPLPGHGRGAHPERHEARPQDTRLPRRRHVRHELGIRLRLPARQHGHPRRLARAARPSLRHRGRGGLHPHRRGPHPAHHLGRRHAGRRDVQQVRPHHAASAPGRGLRHGRGQEDHQCHRERPGEDRGHARHRRPLRRPLRPAGEPSAAGAQGGVPVPPRRGLRRRERGSEDRRRVHGPHHGGPPLLRGPAPGLGGQGARARARGEPDARHHHAAELLPPVREASRA